MLVAGGEGGVVRVDDESCACALAAIERPASASSARFGTRGRGLSGCTREMYLSAHNALSSHVKVAGGRGV